MSISSFRSGGGNGTRRPPQETEVDGRPVTTWLMIVYVLIFLMVIIGGITRLTGSGLSMVDWRPLMGALPPLNEEQWLAVFEQYKASPQFQQVNHWMDLAAFKRIFFWEYIHRLLGRVIGLAVFVPWLWFLARRRMSRTTAWKTFAAFIFGGLQGVLGWYMVQSGLVNIPEVSHFRLAAHLVLAFLVAQWVLWIILDLRAPRTTSLITPESRTARRLRRRALWPFSALVLFQIVYGAFMAGTKAGWLFPTFPTMNGEWVPEALFQITDFWNALVNNHVVIHFIHRLLGYATLFAGAAITWRVAKLESAGLQSASKLFISAIGAQFLLGVMTVVFHVPVALAVSHQAGAFILLSCTTLLIHRLSEPDIIHGVR